MMRNTPTIVWASPRLALKGAAAFVLAAGLLLITAVTTPSARAGTLPPDFSESVVFTGLTEPTALRFASDGRVFVAEKSGVIKVFDNLSDATPTVFADLNANVYNFWDRGLLGLALDPNFPSNPYVYVLYTYDRPLPGTGPTSPPPPPWGTPGVYSDPCPSPPGPTGDGCVVSGRLSRLQAAGNVMTGSEQVLIEDWCQQYPSHSMGSIAFGADGALYVSSGEGASFDFTDYGQDGTPLNPCADPPGGRGATLTPPTAEGGALRSQDLRTTGDPVTLDGAVLRVDPATGAALPDNPLALNPDPNARRIIAYGLRNPFRFTIRPGTSEVWLGDVGWGSWEEINRIVNPIDAVVENFGWPCYEGNARQDGYDGANLNICEDLYKEPAAVTGPYFAYHHNNRVVPAETCPVGSSSVAGLAFSFYSGGSYPAEYDGTLFFADYARDCIWAMQKGGNGLPAPGLLKTFVAGAANPVDLQISPGGELFYADFDGGTIRRVVYGAPQDKAAGRPASASTIYSAGFEAEKAVDGSSTTRWSSAFLDGQWWQVDLGSSRSVDTVKLNWEAAYASRYQILTSLDGTSFSSAAEQLISAPGWATTTFAARQARYVRVLGITRATPYGVSFWDAQVFGPPDGPQPPDTTPPTISITAPADGATVSGTISVNADASDTVGVAGVQFRLDGENLGAEDTSAPYSVSWHTTSSTSGSHSLTAVARDAAGNTRTSSAVSVTVSNPAETEDIALGRPASASTTYGPGFEPGKAVDGSSTTRWSSAILDDQWWQVDLGSSRSVDRVKLNWEVAYALRYRVLTSLDGTTFSVAAEQVINDPGWATTTFAARQARFVRVLGITRATPYGISFWDAQVFGPPAADTAPPSVSITAPADGATVSGTISVNAGASDNVGVAGVQFKLDGQNLGAEDTSAPYSVSWDTTSATNGSHSLTAVARDLAGNTTTSSMVTATVDNSPPTVSITAPADGATVSGTISVTAGASDNVAVAGVQFKLDGQNLGAEDTSAPYSVSWDTTTATDGSHVLTAVARDPAGNTTTSSSVTVTTENNQPPSAVASANPTSGPAPLTVAFDGSGSSDPDPGDTITYEWDLDDDGGYDDSTAVNPTFIYADSGTYTARLKVTDNHGVSSLSAPLTISVNNTPPTATIDTPPSSLMWKVDDVITFSGSATDQQDGALPASALSWSLILHHCPSNCHTHPLQSFSGVAGGSFTAPDHEYPSHLELKLTATDSGGLTDTKSVLLYPRPVELTFQSTPAGLRLVVVASGATAPFSRTVIPGSSSSISAPDPQILATRQYVFSSWSDGGAQSHNITAPETPTTYTANFLDNGPSPLVAAYGLNEASGTTVADASGYGNTGTSSGASPTIAGRFGGAFSFDGTNDWITVPDAASLDLSTGMTLGAWVLPTALATKARTVILKEATGALRYALYANRFNKRPSGHVFTSSEVSTPGTAQLTANVWTHLATTYDGTTLRLYVNGTQVSSRPVSGPISASAGPLRLGGNAVFSGEWFKGMIDEVRIYTRALTASEIQTDMNTALGS